MVVRPGAVGSVPAPRARWVDVSDFAALTLSLRAPVITLARLSLQTAVTEDNDAFIALGGVAWTAPTTTTVHFGPTSAPPLMRWLRWHVQAVSAASEVQFEMNVVLVGRR
jgi:hypothetical protein